MRTPVTIPDLGAQAHPQRLSAWFVESGDLVEQGEPLLEVLISGVTCDVPAPCSGRLVGIEKGLDAPIAIGDVVGWIETEPSTGDPVDGS